MTSTIDGTPGSRTTHMSTVQAVVLPAEPVGKSGQIAQHPLRDHGARLSAREGSAKD